MRQQQKHGTKMYSEMLIYDFDIHKWIYDVKFYLVDGWWCTAPEGGTILRKLLSEDAEIILKYQSEVDRLEQLYQTDDQMKQCRKRTCPCKTCKKAHECLNGCFECIRRGTTVNVGFCTDYKKD